jgi:filamentous hemagglutinin
VVGNGRVNLARSIGDSSGDGVTPAGVPGGGGPVVGPFVEPYVAAAACTWGGASGNWNTAGSWSCGHVPIAGDTAIINTANTVTVAAAPPGIPDSLTVTTGTLNFSGAGTTLTVGSLSQGGGTINASQILTVTGNLSKTAGTLAVTGALNVGGNFTNAGTLTTAGTVTYNGAGAQSVVGSAYQTLAFSGAGTKTLSAIASTTQPTTIGAGVTFVVTGPGVIYSQGDSNNDDLNVNGTLIIDNGAALADGNQNQTFVLNSGALMTAAPSSTRARPAHRACSSTPAAPS